MAVFHENGFPTYQASQAAKHGQMQQQSTAKKEGEPVGTDINMNDDLEPNGMAAGRKESSEKYGTAADRAAMWRMGKTQKMRRNFGFFSIFGFSVILLSTWETQLGTAIWALSNGGRAGAIWMYLGTLFGFTAVIASMAEAASMAPTAGGQYHWISEFAPRKHQKFLSYMVGWLCVLGWQTGSASSAFLAGMEIQSLLILNHSDYTPQAYQGTLLVIGVVVLCGLFNTWLARRLPLIEGCVLILHVVGFFAILIPLWVLAPRSSASAVFEDFTVSSGYGNVGLACLVGFLGPTVSLLGSDAATHMSEELRDASFVLPRAMMATVALNGALGFVMLITICFCLGDLDEVLSSPTGAFGYPFVEIFANGTQSKAGATVMTSILIILSTFCCITNIATASRQLFAFARDQGIPFSGFFAYIAPGWELPMRSIIVTMLITALLALINIGSQAAYNNITSLGVNALLSSYIVSISCICLKRWRGEELLPRRFSLGRAGLVVNVFSVLFLLLVWVMCFFPQVADPGPDAMNWSVVIYAGVIAFSLVFYVVRGRKVYEGPVAYVRRSER